MTAKEQTREKIRKYKNSSKYKAKQKLRQKKDKINKKILSIKQKQVLRRESRRNFNLSLSFLSLLLGIVFLFVVLRTALNNDFQFSLIGILNYLTSIPTISVVELLTYEFNLPLALQFLEPILQFLSFIIVCIVNVVIVLFWFLRFLFIS